MSGGAIDSSPHPVSPRALDEGLPASAIMMALGVDDKGRVGRVLHCLPLGNPE
jgi:hypothetical protein